jgi:hypothetical protein
MKKSKFLLVFLLTLFIVNISWAKEEIVYKPYELDKLIHDVEKPCAPVVTEDYILFTADAKYRSVGIAFDFENYKIVHPFQILTTTDADRIKTKKHMIFCYKRTHELDSIKYRLIIDGLWTTDPLNPLKEYDNDVNLYFSKVNVPHGIKICTAQTDDNYTNFIYKGESGLHVNLAGNFTNWDPWIYELKETEPGLYKLELPLPKGKYIYSYYIGLTPVLDNSNPNKVFTDDGRTANVLYVN